MADERVHFLESASLKTTSREQGWAYLVESCRLEETLGDGEKPSLTIKMARERDSERLAVRPEARGYRH